MEALASSRGSRRALVALLVVVAGQPLVIRTPEIVSADMFVSANGTIVYRMDFYTVPYVSATLVHYADFFLFLLGALLAEGFLGRLATVQLGLWAAVASARVTL